LNLRVRDGVVPFLKRVVRLLVEPSVDDRSRRRRRRETVKVQRRR
jgi:hypothetical protein